MEYDDMNMSTQSKNTPTKHNPKFGIIAPVDYLERYASQSNFHLALAHLADTNDRYADFYHKMSQRGDFIVLDNGAFELGESYNPEKLVSIGNKIAADAIVLPDYPAMHADNTIEAAKNWTPIVKDAGFKTFFAPQSEVGKLEQWIEAYHWGTYNTDIDIIGMSILAIPNAMPHIPKAYARVVMTQLLIDRGVFDYTKYHHYLGLNAGPNLELPPLIKLQAINSCDSSNPVWSGICGQMYTPMCDSFLLTKKIDKHVDFDYPLSSSTFMHQAIQTNIDMTLQLLQQ